MIIPGPVSTPARTSLVQGGGIRASGIEAERIPGQSSGNPAPMTFAAKLDQTITVPLWRAPAVCSACGMKYWYRTTRPDQP